MGDFQLIAAEIKAQTQQIELIRERILERTALIARGEPVVFEGVAFHIHYYYSAVEDLLRIVANAFENNISDRSRWHTELIDRIARDIEGVRPAFLSAETANCSTACAASATSFVTPTAWRSIRRKYRPTSTA
jgi:hypothetical protein